MYREKTQCLLTCVVLALLGNTGCGRVGFQANEEQIDAAVSAPDADSTIQPVIPEPPIPESQFALSLGLDHSCWTRGGRLYCWGNQEGDGALGSGETQGNELSPLRIGIDEDWLAPGTGTRATCGLRHGGAIWCWGNNADLVVAPANSLPQLSPVATMGTNADSLAFGFAHGCFLDARMQLKCWGDNLENQLGLGEGTQAVDRLEPIAPKTEAAQWNDVSAGQGGTCAIASDRSLWCWGRNTNRQLGLGDTVSMQIVSPRQVGAELDWTQVAATQSHTCALKSGGSLWCWGAPGAMLGLGTLQAGIDIAVPTRVGSDSDWSLVANHTFATCALKTDNSLWCWGRNVEGQLGLGDRDQRNMPTQVGTDTDWQLVSLGRFHICAAKQDGSLWCSGANAGGQLGLGDTTPRTRFTQVQF